MSLPPWRSAWNSAWANCCTADSTLAGAAAALATSVWAGAAVLAAVAVAAVAVLAMVPAGALAAGVAAVAVAPKPSSRKADIIASARRFWRLGGRLCSRLASSTCTGGVLRSTGVAGFAPCGA